MSIVTERTQTIYDILAFTKARDSFLEDRIVIHPYVSDDDVDRGILFKYTTNTNPSTTVMIGFSEFDYSTEEIRSDLMFSKPPSDNESLISTVNLFINHPDKYVLPMVAMFIDLLQMESFEIRAIPLREILTHTNPEIDLNNYEGSFFPIIHAFNPKTKEVAYIKVPAIIL
mgnify:CR=1 FL=1